MAGLSLLISSDRAPIDQLARFSNLRLPWTAKYVNKAAVPVLSSCCARDLDVVCNYFLFFFCPWTYLFDPQAVFILEVTLSF